MARKNRVGFWLFVAGITVLATTFVFFIIGLPEVGRSLAWKYSTWIMILIEAGIFSCSVGYNLRTEIPKLTDLRGVHYVVEPVIGSSRADNPKYLIVKTPDGKPFVVEVDRDIRSLSSCFYIVHEGGKVVLRSVNKDEVATQPAPELVA